MTSKKFKTQETKTTKAESRKGFGNIFENMIGKAPKPMINNDMRKIINSLGKYLKNPDKRIKELHKEMRILNNKIDKELKKVEKKNKINNKRIRIIKKE